MNTNEIKKNWQDFMFECVTNGLGGRPGRDDAISCLRKLKDASDDAENMSRCLALLEKGNLDEVERFIFDLQVHYGPDFMKLLELSPAEVRWQWIVWLWHVAQRMGPYETLWCMFHFIPLFVAARDEYDAAIREVMNKVRPMPFPAGFPFA